MNNKLYFIAAILFMFANAVAYAQKEIVVTPVSKQMSRGKQPGNQVSIPQGNLKDIMAAYKKQLLNIRRLLARNWMRKPIN